MTSKAYDRGRTDCAQDACENAPFACVGGLAMRAAPRVPAWVPEDDRDEWLRGYTSAACEAYGDDWATCSFGWARAIAIGAEEQEQ